MRTDDKRATNQKNYFGLKEDFNKPITFISSMIMTLRTENNIQYGHFQKKWH